MHNNTTEKAASTTFLANIFVFLYSYLVASHIHTCTNTYTYSYVNMCVLANVFLPAIEVQVSAFLCLYVYFGYTCGTALVLGCRLALHTSTTTTTRKPLRGNNIKTHLNCFYFFCISFFISVSLHASSSCSSLLQLIDTHIYTLNSIFYVCHEVWIPYRRRWTSYEAYICTILYK